MTTEIILFITLGVLLVLGPIAIWQQRRSIKQLRDERDQIEVEEHRMFDFLHGLGTSLQSDSSLRSMHRFIVRGVTKVVAARGGVLYLLDRHGKELVPAHYTRKCSPFIDVPERILEKLDENPKALSSFLALQSAGRDHPVLGQPLASGGAVITSNLASLGQSNGTHLAALLENVPAMLAPLIYADKEIGVLAVAGRPGGAATPFTENDFDVFKSIAEQSSIALGSALIYREAHEKKQLENEIRNASEIQKILLPASAPEMTAYALSAMNYPAKLVSGDYYDYIKVDDNHLGIVIGDVSGKGIPASLIMAMCRSVVRVKARNNPSAHDVLCSANEALFPDIREDMFISMAYVVLRKDSDEVTLVRAGHDPPMLYRSATKEVDLLKPPGLAVGIDNGEVFNRVTQSHSLHMQTGDALVLYTDGVNEALNDLGEEFGVDALQTAIREAAPDGAQAILDRIADDLREFMGTTTQNDDITLIAIEKR